MDITIKQRMFSNGYEIIAPDGNYNAKKIHLSPTSELQLINSYGSHLARIEQVSFLSSTYNIIVNGGGFYKFGREDESKNAWVCKGEGEIFQIFEHSKRTYSISQGDGQIAEFSKSRFDNQYAIHADERANVTLVVCMVLALSVSEHNNSTVDLM